MLPMEARGVSCIFRQICRSLSEKATKESLRYMDERANRSETPGLAARADAARTTCGGEVEETAIHTYLSLIFVHHTNVLISSTLCS